VKAEDVEKIAIIGAGDMGQGIAVCCLLGSYSVVLNDLDQKIIDRGMDGIKGCFDTFKVNGKMTLQAYDSTLARLIPMVDLKAAAKDADFIIETVPEKMEIKKSVLADLDKYAPQHAILASNTSNMSITEIAQTTSRPDKVIGYHFFNPAISMKLIEVIKGDNSSDESIRIGYDIAKKIKKIPVIVKKDSPGFIYNRINIANGVLLSKILEDGHPTPEEFDAAMKPFMPMAPFEFSDYMGNDINVNNLEYMARALSLEYKPSEALLAYVREGKLGRKTGHGFYNWSQGRPTIDLSKATREYDRNHVIALWVNEATKLLEEGVCDDPRMINMAMANGDGAPFGPFDLAKGIGYNVLLAKLEDLYGKFKLELFKPTKTMSRGRNIEH